MENRGLNVGINITKNSNLLCPECYILDDIVRAKKSKLNLHLNLEKLKRILSPYKLNTVSLCGGEPFLHPELKNYEK